MPPAANIMMAAVNVGRSASSHNPAKPHNGPTATVATRTRRTRLAAPDDHLPIGVESLGQVLHRNEASQEHAEPLAFLNHGPQRRGFGRKIE
jgi:hypothetical protein